MGVKIGLSLCGNIEVFENGVLRRMSSSETGKWLEDGESYYVWSKQEAEGRVIWHVWERREMNGKQFNRNATWG